MIINGHYAVYYYNLPEGITFYYLFDYQYAYNMNMSLNMLRFIIIIYIYIFNDVFVGNMIK